MRLQRLQVAGIVALIGVAVALVGLFGMEDEARGNHGPVHPVNQYAAKFMCGGIDHPVSAAEPLAPGFYHTAVNIHNPNNFPVIIQKKAVVALREPLQGRPSARQLHTLQPDGAMDVDCAEIAVILGPPNPAWDTCPLDPLGLISDFCKGYLVVEAATATANGGNVPQLLDVTNVVTVKEEQFLWKDFTFTLDCQPVPCTPNPAVLPCVDPILCTQAQLFTRTPYNWPQAPNPQPACYSKLQNCPMYNVTQTLTQAVSLACGFCPTGNLTPVLSESDFTTDARDVTLDMEYVSPKRVSYTCWPKGQPGCP